MSKFNLISLPNEILENIFNFLDLTDIKNVTLVCKQFNEVVGSSNKLMNKIMLRIAENENDTQLIRSNRNYRKIFMDGLQRMSEISKSFLQKQSNITYMELHECDLKASEFYWIMKCVSKSITYLDIYVNIESNCEVTSIEFPKLEGLEVFDNEYRRLDFFILNNCFYGARSVKKMNFMSDRRMNLEELTLIRRFFGSMMSLRILKLDSRLFQSDAFLETQLKLENLEIECCLELSAEAMNNIAKFLNTQRSTLKIVYLIDFNITPQLQQSILSMQKLKKFKLFCTKFIASTDQNEIDYNTNYSIEEIYLHTFKSEENDEIMVQSFFKKCAGLKKLNLWSSEISFDMLYTLGHYVENLENLMLCSCTFYAMPMPKIKEMTLYGKITSAGEDNENVIRMIRLNRQLKKIKLSPSLRNNPRCINAIQEINVADVEF